VPVRSIHVILYCTHLVHTTVPGSERSPFVKRRCMMRTADSVESLDSISNASDTSDSSTVNPSTGKRMLPQPKLTVSSPGFTVAQNQSGRVPLYFL